MKTKTPTGKASKGSVTVILSNGRIQLRFHFAGKRHYISTGYPDTPQHWKLAELKTSEIEKDILCERKAKARAGKVLIIDASTQFRKGRAQNFLES
jgi:Arm DNA-binding domain